MTKTGYSLEDVGYSLSWDTLASFLQYDNDGSALAMDMEKEVSLWGGSMNTNNILADIFDLLAHINANLIAIGEGKPAKEVKPYPRPGMKQKQPKNKKHYGNGALPVNELEAWFQRKREERNVRND